MKPERTYFINGQVESEGWINEAGAHHRIDGPAYRECFADGQLYYEEWCINGSRHRLDGPAYRGYGSNGRVRWEHWYVNDKLHRLDGPAIVRYNPADSRSSTGEYYINGVNYKTEAEFLVAVDLYKANEIAELF